jgi:hypothetical protein
MTDTAYQITPDEWSQLCTQLRPAELKIMGFLRAVAAIGEWLNLSVTELAAKVGIHKSSASRALHQLANRNLIDLEILTAQVRVVAPMQQPNDLSSHATALHPRNNVAPTQHPPEDCIHATTLHPRNSVALAQHKTHPRNNVAPTQQRCADATPLKSNSGKGFGKATPQPSLERDLFKQISDQELLAFVEKQNPHAKSKRAYARKCIERDRMYWEERFREWLARGVAEPAATVNQPEPIAHLYRSSCEQWHRTGDRPSLLSFLKQLWKDGRQDVARLLCEQSPQWGLYCTPQGVMECLPGI